MQSSHQPHHTKQPVQHPDHAEPGEMMRQHRQRMLWMDFANLMLGGWLLSTSVVFHAHSSGLMLQIAASRSTGGGTSHGI